MILHTVLHCDLDVVVFILVDCWKHVVLSIAMHAWRPEAAQHVTSHIWDEWTGGVCHAQSMLNVTAQQRDGCCPTPLHKKQIRVWQLWLLPCETLHSSGCANITSTRLAPHFSNPNLQNISLRRSSQRHIHTFGLTLCILRCISSFCFLNRFSLSHGLVVSLAYWWWV
jgi:hypothetical protein